jgi:hypothetical protein
MTQGDEVCEHTVAGFRREERVGRTEPGPGGRVVGNPPGVGIERILEEGGLWGTLECVEKRAPSGSEDQNRARQGEKKRQAKGRRNERVVVARAENAECVEARGAKKCAERLCDRVRILHACGREPPLQRDLEHRSF